MLTKSAAGMLSALALSASMWFYVDRILVPYQVEDAAAHSRPRGNLSDLYPRWLGARELLLHGRDPYSPQVTREIQVGYYGRALDASRADDPQDQQGFAYPVYVVFLLAPTVRMPFNIVQRGFNVLLWLLTGASVLLWMRALLWRPGKATTAILLILTLGSVPAVQGIKLQQLSLLVGALLAGCAAALAGGHLMVAGILLALSTIKPQLAWLPALWLLIWGCRDWRKRQRLVWGFAATMLLLLLGAQMILPGWIGRFREAVENYHRYTHNVSVLGWLSTPVVGDVLAVVLLLVSAVIGRHFLREASDSPKFGVALALVMALTVVVVPMFAPYNQVLLLPVLMILTRNARALWEGKRITRALYGITGLLLFWPWLASIALMFSALWLPAATVQSAWKLPFASTFMLPLLVFGLTVLLSAKAATAVAAAPE